MSRRGYQIDKKIESELKIESKTEFKAIELYQSIKEKYFPELDERKYKKAFFRSLNGLLNSRAVEVIGYESDKNRRKKDSFLDHDNLLLKWSERKTRPEIQNLLNEMGKKDESYQEIRKYFKIRIDDLDKFHRKRWDLLKKNSFKLSLLELEGILSEFQYYKEIKEMVNGLTEKQKKAMIILHKKEFLNFDIKKLNSYVDLKDEITQSKSLLSELEEKIVNKNYELNKKQPDKGLPQHYFDDSFIERLALMLNFINEYKEYGELLYFWFFPVTPSNFSDSWCDIKRDGILYKYSDGTYNIRFLLYGYLKWSSIDRNVIYVLIHSDFKYPETGMECPDCHFEGIIDIIFTYPDEEKKILLSILAKGLSDEPGSINVFAEFFKKMSSINYPQRLNNVLGIVSENPNTVNYDKYKNFKDDLGRVWKLQQMKDDLSL